MGELRKTSACIRIIGDDLDPNEITRLLGATATHVQTKGDKIISETTGSVRIAKFGMWRLSAAESEPGDLDSQIREILNKVTSDLEIWRQITGKFDVDLFCGLFLKTDNDGILLSPDSMLALGERGIEILLDIYGGNAANE